MVKQAENRESIEEAELELSALQEIAKFAAIYSERKFKRRTDLSHIVHASLHFVQFVRNHVENFTSLLSGRNPLL